MESNTKIPKRTKYDIKHGVLNAVSEVVIEKGFMNITLTDISDKSRIKTLVIRNNFGSLDQLIDKYVEKFDFWINHTIETNPFKVYNPKNYYKISIEKVIRSFNRNSQIQKLMRWEVAENNPTTRKTSQKREVATEKLIEYFQEEFNDTGIDINPFIAIVIGGIYHAILKKDISTFCNVDFSTKEGIERLCNASKDIISLLQEKKESQKRQIETIICLYENNVHINVISKAIGLSEKNIKKILDNLSEKNS